MTQQNATFLGVAHPSGGYDPQIRTQPRFLCSTPTPKFHHPVFTCSEVITQTDATENIQRSSPCYGIR